MLYSCTHMATVGIKGLTSLTRPSTRSAVLTWADWAALDVGNLSIEDHLDCRVGARHTMSEPYDVDHHQQWYQRAPVNPTAAVWHRLAGLRLRPDVTDSSRHTTLYKQKAQLWLTQPIGTRWIINAYCGLYNDSKDHYVFIERSDCYYYYYLALNLSVCFCYCFSIWIGIYWYILPIYM